MTPKQRERMGPPKQQLNFRAMAETKALIEHVAKCLGKSITAIICGLLILAAARTPLSLQTRATGAAVLSNAGGVGLAGTLSGMAWSAERQTLAVWLVVVRQSPEDPNDHDFLAVMVLQRIHRKLRHLGRRNVRVHFYGRAPDRWPRGSA